MFLAGALVCIRTFFEAGKAASWQTAALLGL
jgi:hypothetical protein